MKIRATIKNTPASNTARVRTNEVEKELGIEPKLGGRGSGINGGELLFLALASCYCNDVFREAEEMGIEVWDVEVNVEGNFGAKGEPASLVNYDVKISANADAEKIRELLIHTDKVAEIQNSLRISIPVNLRDIEIVQ